MNVYLIYKVWLCLVLYMDYYLRLSHFRATESQLSEFHYQRNILISSVII
jgi:hypothetical protein